MSNVPEQGRIEPASMAKSRNWWPLVASMLVTVVFFHVFPYLKVSPPTIAENRVLASAPSFPKTLGDWGTLPPKLESFAIDQFPLRPYLISGLNLLRYTLGYSGSSKVIVGKDGWLFYDDGGHMALTAGKQMLDKASLDMWVQGLRQRIAYTERMGAKFYFLLGPIKEDIYPEHRPAWMPAVRVATEVDAMVEASHSAGFDQVIDPRPLILKEKNDQQLYDEYDTHWTGLGGYLGYRVLMQRISKDFAGMDPLALSTFKVEDLSKIGAPRNLSLMLGIADYFSHDRVSFTPLVTHPPERTLFLSDDHSWVAPQVLYTDANTGKTLVLLRDSFSNELLPLLKHHFSTIVVAHVQDGFFRPDLIERFKPDAVVVEVIESGARHSMALMPNLSVD